MEHVVHISDLGRVEAERLVELVRLLPSRKAGVRCGKPYGPGGAGALSGGSASGVHGEGRLKRLWGLRARAERTLNMDCMFVTLDVSKLSGWLNADAICRVERRACDARGEVRPGRREALGGGDAIGVHAEGPTRGCGGQGTREAHVEHGVHGRDLGRVEAERLVER